MNSLAFRHTILAMDDDFCVLESLRLVLGPYYEVHLADSLYLAERILQTTPVELITVEPMMADLNPVQFLQCLSERNQETKIMFVSSFRPSDIPCRTWDSPIASHIMKPFDCSSILSAVSAALELQETFH
jgi:response regulator RpfG family c-di-GMP phosphodiesterase